MPVLSGVYVSELRVWEIAVKRKGRQEMRDFFQAVRELDGDCRNTAVAVIEGDFAGSRFLLSDGAIVWESTERDKLYEKLRGELTAQAADLPECGIHTAAWGSAFCERLGQEKKLVICGGGHVAIPLVRLGRMLGCHVTVVEDRPEFAEHAREAGAQEVLCMPFAEGIGQIEGDADTYFVIATRGHRYDRECLLGIAKKKHAYIGMIGSKRHGTAVREAVLEAGAEREVIDRVYTPVGLSIGARTPEEIAVSIAAEIIQVKSKQSGSSFPTDLLAAGMAQAQAGGRMVLATIIRRSGSAPREAGAKMLILEDGRCIGTIGGGYMELMIQKKAKLLLAEGKKGLEVCHVDVAKDAAEEEGMICGGSLDVMLECM